LIVHSEVPTRGGAQSFSEHATERARRTVAGFQSRVRDLRSFRQEPHCLHEAQLLPPLAERHARFLLEESLYSSLAGTTRFADLNERSMITGVGRDYIGHPNSSWI
jgi:hypothetical protein